MIPQEKLKRELAKKYDIGLTQLNEIITCQSMVVADVIGNRSDRETLSFPSVRLPGFGLFYVPEKKLRVLRRVKYDPNHKFK